MPSLSYLTVTLFVLGFLVMSGHAGEGLATEIEDDIEDVIGLFEGHPTTKAPTTAAPTHAAATTKAPATPAPTTHAAATTKAPTTPAPTTPMPGMGHFPVPWPTGSAVPIFNTPYEEANLNVTRTLYDGLLFPNALNIITAGVYPAGIFSNTTAGRITPVGVFDDQVGSFEYFYGLAGSQIIIEVNFIHLIAKGNIVVIRVDLLFNSSTAGYQNLTQEGFITFDSNSRVQSYDLAILRLGEFSGYPTPAEQPYVIEEICEVHEYYCLGANQQYASFTDCFEQISSMNFGTWDNASSNTTTCRELHSLLVPLRPDFHCPHIGPTGGGVCIDVPYSAYYDTYY